MSLIILGGIIHIIPTAKLTEPDGAQLETSTFSGISVGDAWTYNQTATGFYLSYEVTSITTDEVYADYYLNGVFQSNDNFAHSLVASDLTLTTLWPGLYPTKPAVYGGRALTVFDLSHSLWDTTSGVLCEIVGIQILINWTLWGVSKPNPPTLDAISPNPSTTGIITLNWNDMAGATDYYVYRDTSTITSTSGLTPIAAPTSISSSYVDTIAVDGDYYYVIVAGNSSGNSSISNCQSVTVSLSGIPPGLLTPPILSATPSVSTDGKVTLTWTAVDVIGSPTYYVYRATSTISSVAGLVPITTVTTQSYQDTLLTDGTYYYVVVGGNSTVNSSISNCVNVTVSISTEDGIPGFEILFIVISLGILTTIFLRKKSIKYISFF